MEMETFTSGGKNELSEDEYLKKLLNNDKKLFLDLGTTRTIQQ